MPPFLQLCALQVEVPVEADGLRLTPVPVEHVVPTFGYVVSDGQSAAIVAGDSGPTTRLWEIAHQTSSGNIPGSLFSKLDESVGRSVASPDALNVPAGGCKDAFWSQGGSCSY
jgi:hypothetical protein